MIKKKRLLFIASLPTSKLRFDGERNKAKAILDCFYDFGNYDIDIIDYTKNKYFQTLKMLFKSFFISYDTIFLSKCIVGGTIALHLLQLFAKSKKNITFYIVGNGYKGFENEKMHLEDIKKCSKVIIESPIVIEQMEAIDVHNCLIFPCVKPNYSLPVLEKKYDPEETLHAIFFSRIYEHKGILDAVQAIININQGLKKPLFTLDIAGGREPNKENLDFEQKLLSLCAGHDEIRYLGISFSIRGIESYKQLQNYDLHIFPSHFDQECAPGAVVDMFIAGVPTLSSNFSSAKWLMSNENSFFFTMKDVADLQQKLLYIFEHKTELAKKRFTTNAESQKYTHDAFVRFLLDNKIVG